MPIRTAKTALTAAIAMALIAPSVASAAETRSGASLPTAAKAVKRTKAPLKGVRSQLTEMVPIYALIGGAVVVVGWQVIDNGSDG